jgi:PAS domain S-box-containing protein
MMLETMTGYSKNEIISMNRSSLLKTDFNIGKKDPEEQKTRKGFRSETILFRKDGKIISVDFSGFLSVIDNRECVVSVIRDISERIINEEALKKNEAQLRELIATKDKFFNIVAHDLKNPFTSLLGATELLYSNIDHLKTEKIIKLAEILNDSAKSGYAILLNLLDWSRSQTGNINIKPEKINFKNLLSENILELQLSATNKQINITSTVKDDIVVFADKNMINTILRNLLSNSLKFTHKGGKVTVGARSSKNYITVSVKDTGIGISEENVKNLFRIDTRFQLPGTNNEQGTGLGLKLCKEFVEKLGGKIGVKSIENQGSVFIFSIPVN